jgi:hypothetical protein
LSGFSTDEEHDIPGHFGAVLWAAQYRQRRLRWRIRPVSPKVYALASLAAVSLVVPLLEVSFTGHVEPMGKFGIAQTLLALTAIYWWYHLDKRERQYHAGPLMNAAVVALTVFALPVYFIRSRGWKRGGLAIMASIAVLAITIGLEMLGELIGSAVAS